jgi:hypothetical protein
MFCGLYNTTLDVSKKAQDLAARTYKKVHKTIFRQPFLYDKLNVKYWPEELIENSTSYNRWDIAYREKDLKLFIKIPVSCKSSITILEGDYREYNNHKYSPDKITAGEDTKNIWLYQQNHSVLNFDLCNRTDLNNRTFKPISKLQLLAFNTNESHPFADRLMEYLSGSAITPIDEISDNIKRVQRVMKQNNNYFKIEGLWENKIQNIIYDYIMNSGPVEVITIGDDEKNDPDNFGKKIQKPKEYKYRSKQIIVDRHKGYHRGVGHNSKSMLYDVLGYVDKDAEKWYASWKKADNKAMVGESLQTIDIYDGLYNI